MIQNGNFPSAEGDVECPEQTHVLEAISQLFNILMESKALRSSEYPDTVREPPCGHEFGSVRGDRSFTQETK